MIRNTLRKLPALIFALGSFVFLFTLACMQALSATILK